MPGSATTYLKHLTSTLVGLLFDDVVALPRVRHELINRHLGLGLVVNVSGTPKSLHLPIAAADSCWIVYRIQSIEVATCRAKRHFPIDSPHQRVFHASPSLLMCPKDVAIYVQAAVRQCATIGRKRLLPCGAGYWIASLFPATAACLTSLSSRTPLSYLASHADSSSSAGSVKLR